MTSSTNQKSLSDKPETTDRPYKKDDGIDMEIGQVFVATDKGLFPFEILKKSETGRTSKSQQLKEDDWVAEHGLMPHPYDVDEFLAMQESCSYFDACIRQIASDVIGQGWQLVPVKDGVEDEKEKDEITEFLLDPTPDSDEDISDIVEKVVIDWGLVGFWALEVSRDKGDLVNGLWHVPAHTIRVHRDKMKYCQTLNNKHVWFSKFGSKESLSAATGGSVKTSVRWANEMIFGVRYYPKSEYYGIPAILPAAASVFGLLGIRNYNLAFFENYGVPQALVILKGRWNVESAKEITDFIDIEIRGSSNAHKTLVLRPPKDGDIEWTPLGTKIDEAGFQVYIKTLQQDVLSAYKMPPYRIGIAVMGALGGSTAEEMTKIYGNSIVAPLKKTSGKTITKKIIRQGKGLKLYRFEWNPLDTRDLDALTKRLQTLVSIGAMTPSMAAVEVGKPSYEAGNQYFVAANYVPIGEESLEKREGIMTAELERLKGMIEEAITKKEDKSEG
jgi:PBSX family phage portal protein